MDWLDKAFDYWGKYNEIETHKDLVDSERKIEDSRKRYEIEQEQTKNIIIVGIIAIVVALVFSLIWRKK